MCKLLITAGILATAMLVGGMSPAQAQTGPSDPIDVAVRYVLALDSINTSDGPLVFDIRHPNFKPVQHPVSIRPRLVAIARSLGARPGSLHELMVCPTRRPAPEEYLMMPCRFKDRVAAVIQVSEPHATDAGVSVDVVKWTYTEGPTPRTTAVAAISQEVLLARGGDDQWEVVGLGMMSQARF